MHFLYLHTSLKSCGPTSQLLSILSSHPESSKIYIFFLRKKNNQNKIISKSNIKIITSYYQLFKILINFPSKLIIHSSGFLPDILLSVLHKIFFIKVVPVTTLRNIPWQDYPLIFGLKGYLFSFLHILFINQFNIICCSRSVYEVYKKLWFRSKKLFFVDNACVNKIYPINKENNKFPKETLKLISLSQLIPRKNILLLINVLDSLDYNFELDIYGDGILSKDILELCKDKRKINYKGHKDVNEINLYNYDAIISFSSSEGLPNSVIELIVNGKYAILSKIPSHIHLQSLCKNVIILESYNQNSIANIFDYVKNNPPNINEYKKARNYFSPKRMFKEYYELYASFN